MTGEEWRKDHSVWEECKIPTECVVVGAMCGMPQAINSKYRATYERWLGELYKNASTDCEVLPPSLYVADCRLGKCLAVPKNEKPSSRGAAVDIPKQWKTCARAHDCVPVMNNCLGCCEDEAINHGFHDAFYARVQAICKDPSWGHCDYKCQIVKSDCVNFQCVARPDPVKR
jgi:hypothetical protein